MSSDEFLWKEENKGVREGFIVSHKHSLIEVMVVISIERVHVEF